MRGMEPSGVNTCNAQPNLAVLWNLSLTKEYPIMGRLENTFLNVRKIQKVSLC